MSVFADDIRNARERIADVLEPTSMVRAIEIGEELGLSLRLKGELFQRTGSFKARGALNWVRSASPEDLRRGLVTVSAGNHASALAWAAREAGAALTVVMPEGSSPMKIDACRRFGAEVVLHGEINEAMAKMEELRESRNLALVHPFDDPLIIAGQGTVGLEILEQAPDVDVVICPIGGGGLISGTAIAVKSERPGVKIVGVEPTGAPTMRTAWDRGGPVRLERVRTVAPSLGASIVGHHTYELSRRWVDDVVTLDDEEILGGLRRMVFDAKLYAEPGGAVGLAALLAGRVGVRRGQRVVVVVSGGNLDPALARKLL